VVGRNARRGGGRKPPTRQRSTSCLTGFSTSSTLGFYGSRNARPLLSEGGAVPNDRPLTVLYSKKSLRHRDFSNSMEKSAARPSGTVRFFKKSLRHSGFLNSWTHPLDGAKNRPSWHPIHLVKKPLRHRGFLNSAEFRGSSRLDGPGRHRSVTIRECIHNSLI
jgi:hypothetical protein